MPGKYHYGSLPLAMASPTLCSYLYYEEKQQQAFFDDCYPSCLKSTKASVPVLLPRNDP